MFFTIAVLGSYSESLEVFSTSEPLGTVWARRNSPLEWITVRAVEPHDVVTGPVMQERLEPAMATMSQ